MGSEPDDPYPGDGICQTAAEFYSIATKSYNFWSVPSIESQEFDIERHLLSLLAGVPSFSFDSKQRLSWVDGDWLHLKCRSEWETTKASVCDVKVKSLVHYSRLGLSTPISYEHDEGTWNSALSLGLGTSPNMACLIRAWCYILSCRWVESLTIAGQCAQLLHPMRLSLSTFWETILEGKWHAVVIRGKGSYHAPWSWSKNSLASPSVAILQFILLPS